MSRRKFLRSVGITAGALLFNPAKDQASAKERVREGYFNEDFLNERVSIDSGDDRKVNIGVIGCGSRAKGLIGLLKNDSFNILYACDLLDEHLKEGATLSGNSSIKLTKDFKAVLDDKNVEAVLIAVPLFEHFRIAKAALAAGKHVYLEKTMTYDTPQALELVSLVASKPDQVLQVGHQYRYYPLYIKAKQMIEKGYVGKVTHVNSRFDRNASWRRTVKEPKLERLLNWRMYKEYSGGLAAELLSHQMDYINYAFNTHADEVFATGGIDYYKDGRETADNMEMMVRYKKAEMIGTFGATCANENEGYSIKIKGQKGTLSLILDDGLYYPEKAHKKEYGTVDGVTGATKITWNNDGGIKVYPDKLKDPSFYSIRDFHRCVVEKKLPASNVRSGAMAAFMVHMGNKAMESKSLQTWQGEYNV